MSLREQVLAIPTAGQNPSWVKAQALALIDAIEAAKPALPPPDLDLIENSDGHGNRWPLSDEDRAAIDTHACDWPSIMAVHRCIDPDRLARALTKLEWWRGEGGTDDMAAAIAAAYEEQG